MDLPANPFAVLTFISAPAVLTNASCVLLFGTGNRYGRAIDRAHELADTVLQAAAPNSQLTDPDELQLRIRQLESAQTRTLLIVRALTCFYSAVAAFVASTLLSLIGAILVYTETSSGRAVLLALAFVAGTVGVLGMMTGSLMLALESRFSFSVLRRENAFITGRVHKQVAPLTQNP